MNQIANMKLFDIIDLNRFEFVEAIYEYQY